MMTRPFATVPAAALAQTTPPLEWLVDQLFLRAGASILGGPPKAGKSYLALDLAVAVASGTMAVGRFHVPAPKPVLLLAAEDPPAVLLQRLESLARARHADLGALPVHVIVERRVRLPDELDRLQATIAAHRPGLLVLDPLIRCHAAEENSSTEMSVILDGLRHLARTTTATVLVIHHSRKAPSGSFGGAVLRGSSDLAAFADVNLYLRRLSTDGALELKIEHRATSSPQPLRLKLSVSDKPSIAQFVTADDPPDPLATKVLAILEQRSAPLSAKAIRDRLGVRNQLVTQTLRSLADDGRIVRHGRNGWTLPQLDLTSSRSHPICEEPEHLQESAP